MLSISVVVSSQVWTKIQDSFMGEPLPSGNIVVSMLGSESCQKKLGELCNGAFNNCKGNLSKESKTQQISSPMESAIRAYVPSPG